MFAPVLNTAVSSWPLYVLLSVICEENIPPSSTQSPALQNSPCQHTSSSNKIPIQLFFPRWGEHFSIRTHGIFCQYTILAISNPTPANTHHLRPKSPSSFSFLDERSISPFNTWDSLPVHYPCHLKSSPCQHTSSSAKILSSLSFLDEGSISPFNTWDPLPMHYPCHLISYPCQHTSSSAKIPIQPFFLGCGEHFSIQYIGSFASRRFLPSQILPHMINKRFNQGENRKQLDFSIFSFYFVDSK